jgi:hypothetical protein
MKSLIFTLFISSVFALNAPAAVLTANVTDLPSNPNDTFAFDLLYKDSPISAVSFQSTVKITQGDISALTLDITSSEQIESDSNYWLFNNSGQVKALQSEPGAFVFSDFSDDGLAVQITQAMTLAHYVFIWDGTEDTFTFTLDTDVVDSSLLVNFQDEPVELDSTDNSFSVLIPEPASLLMLALGSAAMLKNKK